MEYIKILKKQGYLIKYDKFNNNFKYLSYNSKDIKENTLFFCKGENFKKKYLKEAIKKGATCYVSEKDYKVNIPKIIVTDIRKTMAIISKYFYDHKKYNDIRIGITGTKGKTTTLNFIKNIINNYTNSENAYMSTIDYYTGKEKKESNTTTKESLDIYKCIKDMHDSNIKYLILELSSQGEKLDRIYNMTFDIGIFLNIDIDHISPKEHKDFNEYFMCKLNILKKCKKVLLNYHCNKYKEIKKELEKNKIKVYSYGLNPKCDFYISEINNKENTFSVCYKNIKEEYKLSIKGEFNILNATSSIGVAKLLNIPYKNIKEGLLSTIVPGRMEIYHIDKCPIIVDYAHNKLSIETILKMIKKEYPNKDIKLIFGTPGNKAINRRLEIAKLVKKYNVYFYITEDDPNNENLNEICNQIKNNLYNLNYSNYEIILNREQAIKKALIKKTNNDIILCLGKGEETHQIRKDKYIKIKSDSQVIKEFISNNKFNNKL